MATEFFLYSVWGLVAVVSGAAIARAIFIPSDTRRAPTCGGCGYVITSAAPGRCPECGGQLTKVGICIPSMALRLRGGLASALLAWTTICGMGAMVGWGYIQHAAWTAFNATAMTAPATTKQQHTRNTSFSPNRLFGRNQESPEVSFRIDVDATYIDDSSVIESGSATFKLRENGSDSVSVLEVDLGAGTFELKDAADKTIATGKATEFSVENATQWFDAAGIPVVTSAAKTSRADAVRLVTGLARDPAGIDSLFSMGGGGEPGSLSGGGGSSSSGPVGGGFTAFGGPFSPNYWTLKAQVIVGVLIGVYGTGFAFIWWRRKRMLA